MNNTLYTRTCPKCERTLSYSNKDALAKATKKNGECRTCCRLGGRFSSEHRERLRTSHVGIKHTAEARRNNSLAQKRRYSNCPNVEKTSDVLYTRMCPTCGRDIYYANKNILKSSISKGRPCKVCTNILQRGREFTIECRDKLKSSAIKRYASKENRLQLSESQKKRYSIPENRLNLSRIHIKRYSDQTQRKLTSLAVKRAMHLPEIRKRHIEAIHQSKWVKVKTDIGQLELIEKWNHLGFKFEPNYQICTDSDLFYIDGYDKEHNVVLEYDSKYHRKPVQQTKDLLRQNKIIDILKPKKFWRYDAVNKKCKNVLEGCR